MGPPRERGGERRGRRRAAPAGPRASMGPPRERGGESAPLAVAAGVGGASMGPPRERGGEGGSAEGGSPSTGGFNGAAARTRRRVGVIPKSPSSSSIGFNGAAARTRRRACSAALDSPARAPASMGPPRERGGEAPDPAAGRRRGLASMGPPRERGGEFAPEHATRARASGFNGAAARTRRRARMWGPPPPHPHRFTGRAQRRKGAGWARDNYGPTCFNGAARTRRKLALRHDDGCRLRASRAAARTRRRGPPRRVCRVLRNGFTGPPRGRGGEQAGGGAKSGASAANGAAARTRRKPEGGRNDPGGGAATGPPRETAEMARGAAWAAPPPMGPPRERRGGTCSGLTVDGSLQWGRRANAAERSCSARAARNASRRLQWGRRANAAERLNTSPRRSASISCFNGAAARTRRRADR